MNNTTGGGMLAGSTPPVVHRRKLVCSKRTTPASPSVVPLTPDQRRELERLRQTGGTASLTITLAPDYGHNGRLLTIACEHGSTYLGVAEVPGKPVDDGDLVALAVMKHELEEGCGCCLEIAMRIAGVA